MRKPRKDDLLYALQIVIGNVKVCRTDCPPDRCESYGRPDHFCGRKKEHCWEEFAINRAITWGDEIKRDNALTPPRVYRRIKG